MGKLSKIELEALNNKLNQVSKTKAVIGELEVSYHQQKTELFSRLLRNQEELNDAMSKIEQEHGKCTIDIKTGDITPIEESNNPTSLKKM